jgi:hypothetical protein
MYVHFGRKVTEQINPKVQDYRIKNNNGKSIAGG